MRSPDSPDKIGKAEKPENKFDELINEMIAQRKLQQEALGKIKASVERTKSGGQEPSGLPVAGTPQAGSHPKSTSNQS